MFVHDGEGARPGDHVSACDVHALLIVWQLLLWRWGHLSGWSRSVAVQLKGVLLIRALLITGLQWKAGSPDLRESPVVADSAGQRVKLLSCLWLPNKRPEGTGGRVAQDWESFERPLACWISYKTFFFFCMWRMPSVWVFSVCDVLHNRLLLVFDTHKTLCLLYGLLKFHIKQKLFSNTASRMMERSGACFVSCWDCSLEICRNLFIRIKACSKGYTWCIFSSHLAKPPIPSICHHHFYFEYLSDV